MLKKHDNIHYRYSQHLHTLRVWRVVILLMRIKYVGPARVNTQFQGNKRRIAECAYTYNMYTVHIVHTAHLFFTHSVYI